MPALLLCAQDPKEQLLLSPAYAIARLMTANKLKVSDVNVWEIHEAFAGQVLANLAALDSDAFTKDFIKVPTKIGQVCAPARYRGPFESGACACAERTGAAARKSPQRDRPGGLTRQRKSFFAHAVVTAAKTEIVSSRLAGCVIIPIHLACWCARICVIFRFVVVCSPLDSLLAHEFFRLHALNEGLLFFHC